MAIKLATTAATLTIVVFVLEPRVAASAEAALTGKTFTTTEFLPLAIAASLAVLLLILNVTLGGHQARAAGAFQHIEGNA